MDLSRKDGKTESHNEQGVENQYSTNQDYSFSIARVQLKRMQEIRSQTVVVDKTSQENKIVKAPKKRASSSGDVEITKTTPKKPKNDNSPRHNPIMSTPNPMVSIPNPMSSIPNSMGSKTNILESLLSSVGPIPNSIAPIPNPMETTANSSDPMLPMPNYIESIRNSMGCAPNTMASIPNFTGNIINPMLPFGVPLASLLTPMVSIPRDIVQHFLNKENFLNQQLIINYLVATNNPIDAQIEKMQASIKETKVSEADSTIHLNYVIGPNGTTVPKERFDKIDFRNIEVATKELLALVFDKETKAELIEQSATGNTPERIRPIKSQKDTLNDVIYCVQKKFNFLHRKVNFPLVESTSQ